MSTIAQTVVESRLDYLTVTAVEPKKQDGLFHLGMALVDAAIDEKNKPHPFRANGYEGRAAQWASVGKRADSVLVRLSGAKADEWFDYCWLSADHCTRIDLCVTVRYEGGNDGVAKRAEAECNTWKAETGRTLKCWTIRDNGYTNTCYLGQRVSDLFARVYDKRLESGDVAYEGCWRWEVEVKGDPAQRTASALHSCGDRPGRITSAVHSHFSRRGVTVPFEPTANSLHLQTIRAPSDATTRLRWLSESVRPCVQWLCGAGYVNEACEALGLPRSVSERYRLSRLLDTAGHVPDELDEFDAKGQN